jgi:hypothetical protein
VFSMYLSGSINDFIGILKAAENLQADSIHFIFPNILFVLANNKQDYLYAETNMYVGQSILVPRSSYKNMKIYIDKARKQGIPLYQRKITSLMLTPGKMILNEDEELTIEVDILTFPLKKEVEFKLKDSIQSGYNPDGPYLRVPQNDFKSLNRQLTKYKKQYDSERKKTSINTIRIEEGQLVLYHEYKEMNIRFETNIRTFVRNTEFPDMTYEFTDRCFYLSHWLSKNMILDEVVLLPRPDYCVIEGHMSNMVIKVRTMF